MPALRQEGRRGTQGVDTGSRKRLRLNHVVSICNAKDADREPFVTESEPSPRLKRRGAQRLAWATALSLARPGWPHRRETSDDEASFAILEASDATGDELLNPVQD